jgi:hypothetical protein
VKSRLACTMIALACLGAVACASAPTTKDAEGPQAQAAELDLDSEVEELVFGHDSPFVLRVDPSQWSTVAPYARQLVDAAPIPDYDRPAFELLSEDGPLGIMLEQFSLQDLEHLDGERSVWLTSDIIDADATLRAASMGLTWLPESDYPAGYVARLVIPVTDAQAAAESARSALKPPRPFETTRVVAHTGHIQIDAVASEASAEAVWERLDAASAPAPRATPALLAFLDDSAPLALYGRTAALRQYGTAQLAYDVSRAAERATPENLMRIHAMGASSMLNQHKMAPASEREFEDVAVIGRSAGDAGIAMEAVATRTALGRALQEASGADISLPQLSTEVLADDDLLVDLTWRRDLHAAAAAAPLEPVDDQISLGDLGRFHSVMYRASDAFRTMGWTGLIGLAHSPTYLPRLALAHMDDELRELVPVAARLRLVGSTEATGRRGATTPDLQPVMTNAPTAPPVAGALVLRFQGTKEAVEAALAPHTSTLEQAASFGLTHQVVGGPDAGAELHLALGHPLEDMVLDERKVTPQGISGELDLATFERIERGGAAGGDSSPWELASPLHLRSAHTPSAAAWTLVSAGAAAEPKARQTALPALDNPPVCLDQMVDAGMDIFAGFERMSPGDLAQADEVLAPYDEAADSCAQDAPDHADALRWSTGRARWMVAQRHIGIIKFAQELAELCEGDDEGARARCEQRREHYDADRARAVHEAVEPLLAEACERGDQVACDTRDALPELDALPQLDASNHSN